MTTLERLLLQRLVALVDTRALEPRENVPQDADSARARVEARKQARIVASLYRGQLD